jgi:hypothetical protein
MIGKEIREKVVTSRLTQSEYTNFIDYCDRNKVTYSDFIREGIMRLLKSVNNMSGLDEKPDGI